MTMRVFMACLVSAFVVIAAGCGNREEVSDDADALVEDGLVDDADALVENVGRAFLDHSVRGEMTVDGLLTEDPDIDGGLSMTFSIDDDHDLSYVLGMDAIIADGLPDDTEIEIRHVDGESYMGFPAEAVAQAGFEATGDTAWFTVRSEPVGTLMWACGANITSPEEDVAVPCSPLTDLERLTQRFESAAITGSEDVAGTPTTVVHFQVPLRELPVDAETSYDDPEPLDDILGTSDGAIDVKLWLDDAGMPRRFVVDTSSMWRSLYGSPVESDENDDDILMRTTVDFYDIDADISIDAPPTDSIVADYGDLADSGLLYEDD